MQSKIDDKFRDRLTNTPKRLCQDYSSRFEGERLKRTQIALHALADLHDSGQVPDGLQWVKTKTQVYNCMGEGRTMVPNGYHAYHIGTGKPYPETPETLALWSLLTPKTEAEKQADELQQKINGLQFSKIPSYFPTPDNIIDLMLDHADIQSADICLEPSAGHGAIADKIKPLCSQIDVIEQNYTLSDILKLKGYAATQGDFMETEFPHGFDKIVSNPPFEKLQDIDHVRRAYECLNPGGRLVSIMSPSPFFNSVKKAEDFRQWFDSVGGEKIDLPEGSFKPSGTGINTCMVIIDK